jgi:hypothetical protein
MYVHTYSYLTKGGRPFVNNHEQQIIEKQLCANIFKIHYFYVLMLCLGNFIHR